MKPHIKNIIFDWSGVINDNTEALHKTVIEMFREKNVPAISFEEMRKNWEQPYMNFYQKYIPNYTHEEEKEQYERIMPKQKCYRCHPGMADLLQQFKNNGIKMVILSSDSKGTIFKEIKEFGLENIFQEIRYDIHDKAEEIHDILMTHGFKPEETIFIGDTAHEVEVGKIGKTLTGAVTWGLYPEERLKKVDPDYIIHNVLELKAIILK